MKPAGYKHRFLHIISFHREEQKNFVNLTGKNVFSTLVGVFTSVSLLQAFLIGKGVSEALLGTINIVSNAAGITGMLITMGIVDRVEDKKLIRILTMSNFPGILLPLAMLFISIFSGSDSPFLVFLIAAVCWAVYSLSMNFRGVIDTKVGPALFSPAVYGTVFGISGMMMYLIGTGFSFGLKPLLDYQNSIFSGYSLLFGLTILTFFGTAFFASRLKMLPAKENDQISRDEQQKLSLRQSIIMTLGSSKLRNVFLLHLFRGVNNAMVYFFVPVGMHFYGMSLSYAAYITTASMIASVIGYLLVTLLYDRLGSVKTNLLGILLQMAGLGVMALFHTPWAYLTGVFIFFVGHILYCQCIPLSAYTVTPKTVIGSMTVIRLVLMQGVEAFCTFLLGMTIQDISIYLILGVVLIALLIQGLLVTQAFSSIPRIPKKSPRNGKIPLQARKL